MRCTITHPELVFCHCSQCRKTAGAPFLAVFPVAATAVVISDHAGTLREFRASPAKVRAFCGRCGAAVYSRRDGDATLRLRAGLFDDLGAVNRIGHIHTEATPGWDNHRDDLPRYAGLEPGRAPLSGQNNEPT